MPRLGVVGATGAVGTVTLQLLAERGFDDVRAFASARSAGRTVRYGDHELTVEEATPEKIAAAELDLCFFSVGTGPSSELVPATAEAGTDVHRQIRRLPAYGRDPARGRRRERRRARRRPHRRQPELFGDPAQLRAQAAARRRRPGARAAGDLPVDVRRGRRRDRATSRDGADAGRPGDGLAARR